MHQFRMSWCPCGARVPSVWTGSKRFDLHSQSYGIFPSLAALCGWNSSDAGAEVLFIDAHAENIGLTETVERLHWTGLHRIHPDNYLFFQSMDWIKAIKEHVDVPVLVGGVYLFNLCRETLAYPEITRAVTGEVEHALPELLNALMRKQDLSTVRGIVFKHHDGRIVVESS